MREYPVKIAEKALGDMNGIYEYIAFNLQSPENAMGQYNRKNRYLQTGGSNHIISPNGGFIWYVKPDNRGVKRHGIIPT